MSSDSRHDRTITTTPTGWKLVGAEAAGLLRESGSAEDSWSPSGPHALVPGDPADSLYGATFTLQPRSGSGQPGTVVLEVLTEALRKGWPEAPRLRRDEPVERPATRFTGVHWDGIRETDGWTGELLWRQPHPTVRGAACTTHLLVEERERWTRMSVRVTADRGLSSVRGLVGAGHARPDFLTPLRRRLDFTFRGGRAEPRTLEALDIDDFVENRLLLPGREVPIVVLSPEEEGGYLIDPEELMDELLGVAHLYVIREHRVTFRLSDALGDRRMSCYWGAVRGYQPGMTRDDDPLDHPLLTADRVVDPVMRAGSILGPFAHRGGRVLEMPEGVASRRGDTNGPLTETDSGPQPTRSMPGSRPAPTAREPDGAGMQSDGSGGEVQKDRPTLPVAPAGSAPSSGAVAPTTDPQVRAALGEMREMLSGVLRSHTELLARVLDETTELRDEVEQLRTVSSLRSARTGALERRIGRLEERLERWMEAGGPEGGVPEAAEGAGEVLPEEATGAEQGSAPDEETRPTLVDVVRRASEAHQEHLLVLDSAVDAARDSPYEDPEQVAVVLDAMARIARKRADGSLGTSLVDAFRDLGIDYRGGIAKSTSKRMREQYLFAGADGDVFDCVEHIAMGSSYDPRFCLRIYFTSRVPVESRFVIGHVGRHFDVKTTT